MDIELKLLAATAALTLSAPATAEVVTIAITGDYSATFRLDRSPTLDPTYIYDGYGFSIANVAGAGGAGPADVTFFRADGILISRQDATGFAEYLLDAGGATLYEGSESAPRLKLGNYALSGFSTPGTFSVAISAVPELDSWAMMIGGLGMVGIAMRYRRRTQAVRFAA